MSETTAVIAEWRRRLESVGQAHLLRFEPTLKPAERTALLGDLEQLDLERITPLIDSVVRRKSATLSLGKVRPPPIYPARPTAEMTAMYANARRRGEEAISAGRVAAFMVAGGQGTRLGFDGPKGAFRITPVRDACLFQVFAENLLGIERRYGKRPRWYIMTSPANHEETIRIFEQGQWFGLTPDDVAFFSQAQMPAFDFDGRIALAARHRIALSPDGHGGSLHALARSGALADMRERGIDHVSYFQVDNPLVKAVDPLFVGLHIETGSEMSSKAVTKCDDLERVGNFCVVDDVLSVIEYSDLPEPLARARNTDGTRMFDAGSIAIHILAREFVERLTTPGSEVQLPWHRAEKKVPMVNEAGEVVEPDRPNAVKLEMFVFDAIPLARNPLVLYTEREEEFSPVKNADGTDSPATTRRDLVARAARWMEAAGWKIPRHPDGKPDTVVEIAPSVALDAADLRERGPRPRTVARGERLALA